MYFRYIDLTMVRSTYKICNKLHLLVISIHNMLFQIQGSTVDRSVNMVFLLFSLVKRYRVLTPVGQEISATHLSLRASSELSCRSEIFTA